MTIFLLLRFCAKLSDIQKCVVAFNSDAKLETFFWYIDSLSFNQCDVLCAIYCKLMLRIFCCTLMPISFLKLASCNILYSSYIWNKSYTVYSLPYLLMVLILVFEKDNDSIAGPCRAFLVGLQYWGRWPSTPVYVHL